VVEDDYDGEFRYHERPLPSLQSLDRQEGVIYVGTFSKTLLPFLRLGYLIVPRMLIKPFLAMKLATTGPTAMVSQRAVSRFIESGMFYRHVRAMRALYARRRAALATLIGQQVPELVIPQQEAAGLFMTTLLRADVARVATDVAIAAAARKEGLHVEPLSALYVTEARRSGLVFGFGGISEEAMQAPLRRLAGIIRVSMNGDRSKQDGIPLALGRAGGEEPTGDGLPLEAS
jgi:GntR family transcriptional regulator/MocR family aminotransferase